MRVIPLPVVSFLVTCGFALGCSSSGDTSKQAAAGGAGASNRTSASGGSVTGGTSLATNPAVGGDIGESSKNRGGSSSSVVGGASATNAPALGGTSNGGAAGKGGAPGTSSIGAAGSSVVSRSGAGSGTTQAGRSGNSVTAGSNAIASAGTSQTGGSTARGGSSPVTAGASSALRVPCTPPGSYRNLFVEFLGKTEDEVDAKLKKMIEQLFHGSDDQKIYYEMADGKAQIYDIASGDVRSEGQSYGMMMAVLMDMRTEFDKLWTYAASCMRQPNGTFTWSMQQGSCSAKQSGFAPDGEEYFAMALLLASRRWDTSTGIDYAAEAKKVLTTLATKDEFSKSPACVFYTQNSGNSDPSYVLPLFYSEWACLDPDNAALWNAATTHAQKTFFHNACNKQTGLASERSALDGTPQDDFGPDSWRVPMNIMMDFNLNAADAEWQISYAKTQAAFWIKEGLTSYGDRYSLSGEKKNPGHGPGLDGVNAMLAFALPAGDANAKALLQRAWDTPLQTGQYRYYNGCLQALAFLHTSGRFNLFY